MESVYGNEEFMDEEILEALYENPYHHQQEQVFSPLDESETKQDSNDDIKKVVNNSKEQENIQPCFNEEMMLMNVSHVPSYKFDESLQQIC